MLDSSAVNFSICIPIYNCGDFIGAALDSIMSQTDGGTEVIVFDGGSTDQTETLMAGYTSIWKNIRYIRAEARGGIDADLVTCVSYARGEFCWLFSGDDVMRPGALLRVREYLKTGHDIYICQHTICSKDMVFYHDHPVMQPNELYAGDISNADVRAEWFGRASTTEAFFSFLSGIIVRRETWLRGDLPEAFARSCWGHVARFFGLVNSGLKTCYVAEILLDQRGENDSFASNGVVNRFRIGIEGYHRLADHYFGHNSIEAFHIRRVIRNEFDILKFLLVKILCEKFPVRENIAELNKLVRMTYCDKSLRNLFNKAIYFGLSCRFISLLRLAYQPVKSIRRVLKRV